MKITKEQFKSVDFMTDFEKYQIAKHFKRFVENGFKINDFHTRLYEHLHGHCGFIAHYNREGFYHEYFNTNRNDLKRFVESFLNINAMEWESKYNGSNVDYEPYKDINKFIADTMIENKIIEKYNLKED